MKVRKMPRGPLTSLLMLLLISSTVAGPMFKLSETEFDWGRTCQHATVSHRFWIESIGDDTLVITKIVPGCGCTKAPLRDSILAPGQKTPLDIFFSTKSYSGKVKKVTYFETNANDLKTRLRIRAELLPKPDSARPIYISPIKVDISQFRPKPRTKSKFFIINADTVDYALTLIDHADHIFDLDWPDSVKAGDSVKVAITLHEDSLDFEFDHSVTFQISDEMYTRYSVPIRRMIRIKEER